MKTHRLCSTSLKKQNAIFKLLTGLSGKAFMYQFMSVNQFNFKICIHSFNLIIIHNFCKDICLFLITLYLLMHIWRINI